MKNHLDFSGNAPAFPAPIGSWTGLTERTYISIELLKAMVTTGKFLYREDIDILTERAIYAADSLMKRLKETHKE